MHLILMRHGEAERQTPQDNERQLTNFGRQQAEETAEKLLAKYTPDHFVVSPYDRAQQTLETFTSRLPDVPVSVHDDITPSDDAMQAISGLADVQGECVLVVCHMPIVAKLAGLLTGQSPESYALAEARVIELEFVASDMGEEVERFVPKQN